MYWQQLRLLAAVFSFLAVPATAVSGVVRAADVPFAAAFAFKATA